MATPKNVRSLVFSLHYGGCVHTYINKDMILLQIRKSTQTEEDVLTPSFKVAVRLSSQEALAIASELILAVSNHLKDPSPLAKIDGDASH